MRKWQYMLTSIASFNLKRTSPATLFTNTIMSNKPKHCLLKSFEHSRKVLGKANGSGGQNENKTGNIAQWASFKKRKQKTYTK